MKRSRSFACLIFSVVVSLSPALAHQTGKALTSEQIFSRINSIETLSYQARIRSPAGRTLRIKIWIKGHKVRADGGGLKTGQIGKRGFQYFSNQWVVSPGLSINTVITFLKEAREIGDTHVIGKQTINGEDTTIIEYTQPRWDDFFNEIKVTLWVSHKTLLPIKVIETNITENKIQTTEVSAISFEDIDEKIFEYLLKADEQAKRQIKEKWKSWQESKEKEYQRFLRNDEDQRFTPERKVDLWQSFLSSICKNNPHSTKDDEMRSHARSRMLFWMNKTSVSAIHPPPKSPGSGRKETGRDSTFIAYDNGVVKDTATGLEWIAGLDVDTTWNDAQTWVQDQTADGGGWRMPTTEELITLYKKGAGEVNMTPLLKTKGFSVWSGQKKDALTAWMVGFFGGKSSYRVVPIDCNRCMFIRAFAVRTKPSQ